MKGSAWIVVLVLWTAILAGCWKTQVPVLDLKVAEGDWTDYQRSLEAITERQTPEERAEFAQALQELKFQAMLGDNRPSTGPEISAQVRAQIAGLTVRDVLVLSLTMKLGRKQEQENALLRSILMNARLRTKAGDDASAIHLKSVRISQARQLEELRGEISVLRTRFEELSPRQSKPF